MPPLEAWEKVFFDNEAYFEDTHANLGCITCHGGTDGVDDMEAAHEGMVRDPDAAETCSMCHAETVETFDESLHWDLQGYMTVLQERSDEEHWPQVMEAYDNHCASCHASCGQCHVSRPTANGGGLLDGHVFKKTPPPYTTCTGCHGSRVENEYKGKNKDEEENRIPADVHYNPGGMHCNDCHSGDEMHGTMGDFDHRYDGAALPSCTDAGCHDDLEVGGAIPQHSEGHLAQVSCQVCHTAPYKSCYNCHVQQSDEGVPYYKIDESQMGFQIGLNPIRSGDRPWKYVPVRHVPIARDSFSFYGDDLLPNFDSLPTWKYATPHAIQRVTPQNQGCTCHEDLTLFLTADDVDPDELEANQAVIVAEIPAMALSDEPPTPEPTVEPTPEPTPEPITVYTGPEMCSTCHADQYALWSDGPHAYESVTCIACHNALLEQGHPTTVVAGTAPDAQVCANCHTTTASEWDSSKHAQEDVQCQVCHAPHTRNLTAQSATELCAGCHVEYLKDEAHLSHGSQQLDCLDCHMYIDPNQETTAHSFVADVCDCTHCHTDSPHTGDAAELLNTHTLKLGCAVCHTLPGVAEADLTMHDIVEASESFACTDCHAAEGNFDWTAAGYSADDAAEFTWSEYPPIEAIPSPSSEPSWFGLLGIGLVIAGIVAVPLVLGRNNRYH